MSAFRGSQEAARAMLAEMTSAAVAPAITSALDSLLAEAARVDRFDRTRDADTEWSPNTAIALGDRRVPRSRTGLLYEATAAGATAAAEPTWPVIPDATVVDGGVTWRLVGRAWTPATAYVVGDKRVPVAANGHVYEVTVAGVSGSKEPPWPTAAGDLVNDGTATLRVSGALAWQPTYDLNAAAAEGWRRKAALVADRFDFSEDGQTFQRSQQPRHFLELAEHYAGLTDPGLRSRPSFVVV